MSQSPCGGLSEAKHTTTSSPSVTVCGLTSKPNRASVINDKIILSIRELVDFLCGHGVDATYQTF